MIFKFSASEIERAFKEITKYVKPGASYVIEIQKAKSKRSLNQNRYYWGVVVTLMSQTTGYTEQEQHQLLAKMFLLYDKDGQPFIRSTADLNTIDFEKYLAECRQLASDQLGIHIPLPNEITEEVMMHLRNVYNY